MPPAISTTEFQARLAWVEEQCSTEQKQRAEMEKRLTQHLNALVGISISEQLDTLRQQLIEERMQRQVDITSVRANLESIRSEIQRDSKDVLSTSGQEDMAAKTSTLSAHLEEISAELRARLDALEVPTGVTRLCVPGAEAASEAVGSLESSAAGSPALRQDVCRLQRQTSSLEEQLTSLEQKFERLEGADGSERERTLALVDERLAAQRAVLFQEQSSALSMAKQAVECSMELTEQCSKMEARLREAGTGPLCCLPQVEVYVREKLDGIRQEWGAVIEKSGSRKAEDGKDPSVLPEVLSHVRGYMTERLDGMRTEWKALIDDEHVKGYERAQVLGRKLGEEFERSITNQAIAEARAEACSTVSSMLVAWHKDNAGTKLETCASGSELQAAVAAEEVPATLRQLRGDVADLFALVKAEEEQRKDAQTTVASLKGDMDGLRTKLQERAPHRLEELTDRVTSLETAFQHVEATAQADVEATTARKIEQLCADRLTAIDLGLARVSSEMEQLCADRLTTIDRGLSRVSNEVKQQGEGLQQVQRRQKVFSDEFLSRLQALVDKLAIKGLEYIGGAIRDSLHPPSPGLGGLRRNGSSPRRVQAARSPPYPSHGELPDAQAEVAKRAASRGRSPSACPEDDSVHQAQNGGSTAALGAPRGCGTSAPSPTTPGPHTVREGSPVRAPAPTYRSAQAGVVLGTRQSTGGAPRVMPTGSPTMSSRPPMVLPPHSVVTSQRVARVRCLSPGGSSSTVTGNGVTRLSSAPGKP